MHTVEKCFIKFGGFETVIWFMQQHCHFLLKKSEELLHCKSSSQFFSKKKNTTAIKFVSAVRDNESSTNSLVKLTRL